MTKSTLIGLTLIFALSCDMNNDDEPIKQGRGNVWLSGGLYYCAEQIHLDNGDTMIANLEDIISFSSGDRVNVKYKEVGINESCPPGIDCEIVEIEKVD